MIIIIDINSKNSAEVKSGNLVSEVIGFFFCISLTI